MKKILVLAVFVMAGGVTLAALRAQNRQTTPAPQEQYDSSSYPVADYEASEPSDPRTRALRKARGKRNNLRLRPSDNVDVRQFMLTESSDSSWGGPPSHAPSEPALPAGQSAAVVVGEVTQARAFLSDDKTSVYSEFTVRVGDVLKNNSAAALAPGDSVAVVRAGGAVRFPSGKVIRRGSGGRPLPRVGRRYVFFLRYDTEGEDFPVITAYELRGGRVIPLDGLDIDGTLLEPYAAYQEFKGVDENVFLGRVREAIGNASASERGKEVE